MDGLHWFRWASSHLPGPPILPKGSTYVWIDVVRGSLSTEAVHFAGFDRARDLAHGCSVGYDPGGTPTPGWSMGAVCSCLVGSSFFLEGRTGLSIGGRQNIFLMFVHMGTPTWWFYLWFPFTHNNKVLLPQRHTHIYLHGGLSHCVLLFLDGLV